MPWWFVRCYPYSDTISQVDYVAIVGLVMLAAFSVAPVGSNILVLLGQGLSRGREYSACCGYEDVLFIAEVVQDLLHLFKSLKHPDSFSTQRHHSLLPCRPSILSSVVRILDLLRTTYYSLADVFLSTCHSFHRSNKRN